jgi:hypothetical protein
MHVFAFYGYLYQVGDRRLSNTYHRTGPSNAISVGKVMVRGNRSLVE